MKNVITFILNLLMINNDDNNRVGLSQFKEQSNDLPLRKPFSSKDVKLSDLLRRA